MRASTEQNEKIHICYWPAERSVLGKTVPEVLVRPEGRVFPDLGRQIMCLLFSSVEYFLSVEFSLQPISNLVMNACV